MSDEMEIEFELDPDPGWYPVPESAESLRDWAVWLVRELAGPDADEDRVRGSAEVVMLHAELAHEQLAELAYVFLPDPLAPVLASALIELVFGIAGDLPDLDEIATTLSERRPEHMDAPTVSRRLLTAGPSVRQHVLSTEEDGEVMESVKYVVAVPGMDDALLRITTGWSALALGEALVEQADRLAAALIIRLEQA